MSERPVQYDGHLHGTDLEWWHRRVSENLAKTSSLRGQRNIVCVRVDYNNEYGFRGWMCVVVTKDGNRLPISIPVLSNWQPAHQALRAFAAGIHDFYKDEIKIHSRE
jgi:hypothetical protein